MKRFLTVLALVSIIGTAAHAQYQKYPSSVSTTDQFFGSGRPWVDVQSQGARGDGQQITDAVTNSTTTITSVSALFNSATDIGKVAICVGCNSGANLITTISVVNSSSSVTLAASAKLTLPVILTGGGCSTNPYGYITVASTGVPSTAGVVTANGTSSCATAPFCVIELQAGQAGSGATCTTSVSGGVVTAINVSGGTGYTALFYWGTDDSTSFGNALTAACGSALFVSKPQKSFYLINTSQTWQNCSGTSLLGTGYGSWIAGDPGANPLISISGGTASSLEVAGVRLSNLHTAPSGNSNWPDLTCNPCVQIHIHNNYFVGGRPGINLTANATTNVSSVEIDSNKLNAAIDFAIDSGSGLTTQNQNVMIHDNYIGQSNPTIFTTIGAPGHDINLEDTGESEIHDNYIWDSPTSVPGVSCLQVYVNHASSGVSHDKVRGNICNETQPSVNNTIAGFLGANNSTYIVRNLDVEGNTFDGYFNGFNWSGISAANQLNGLLLKGNQIFNTQGTSAAHAIVLSSSTVVDERIVIEGNVLVGPAAGTVGGQGISLNRISGISVVDNHISFSPQDGIGVGGVENSVFCGNLIYNNSQQTANTYSGITIGPFTNNSANNTVCDNIIYDDQATQTQKYGIVFSSSQTFHHLIGNTFPTGNKTANVSDGGTTGVNSCTTFGSTVGCDYESVTGNIASQTLIPATYLATFREQFRVSGYLVCYASVAGSLVTLALNYVDDFGTQTPTELSSVSCASAGQRWVFQDVIRLNNGSALSYSTTTVNSPVYRMSIKVEEQ